MATTTRSSSVTALRALQVFATLTVVNLLYQFVTAGTLFGQGEGLEEAHAAGAIVLHVSSGLTVIAAGLLWRVRGTAALLPLVLSAVVFVFSFVQAYDGERSSLAIHIPGAMILVVGAVWVMAASFGRGLSGAGN